MSRSPTTTNPDWLHNSHAGELLVSEFIHPMALELPTLAHALEVDVRRLEEVISGKRPMDAELDLRLTRYLGLGEGFFMRLQVRHDIIEAKRALNGRLDRIVPRAA